MIIVETDKGKKFGGYTLQTWNHDGNYKNDEKAFCFSLNNKKIYNKNPSKKKALDGDNLYGARFGDTVFKINDKAFKNGGLTTFSDSYDYKNREINDGEENFRIVEIEVFRVLFL